MEIYGTFDFISFEDKKYGILIQLETTVPFNVLNVLSKQGNAQVSAPPKA